MKNVLITGGSGRIGRQLTERLLAAGYQVGWLTSSQPSVKNVRLFEWDYKHHFIDKEIIEFTEVIIHLAGADVSAGRWTSTRMEEISGSRVDATDFLFQTWNGANGRLQKIIAASAVGYYGLETADRLCVETDSAGFDFLAHTCMRWERKTEKFGSLGVTPVIFRLGVVLDESGGFLDRLKKPLRFGVGPVLGSGEQWVPWIHMRDVCDAFMVAVEQDMWGTYNLVAPEMVTYKEVLEALAQSMKRNYMTLGLSERSLRLLMGEISGMLVNGNRVSSDKLRKAGMQWRFPDLKTVFGCTE